MQTFVPYGADFPSTARCLDYRRLGKQRVEGMQILAALSEYTYGWQNHPAVNMWRGYECVLAKYTATMCIEWRNRGYDDSILGRLDLDLLLDAHNCPNPEWLYDDEVILSHRSNLVRKLPAHYRFYWPDIPDDMPYVWPVN